METPFSRSGNAARCDRGLTPIHDHLYVLYKVNIEHEYYFKWTQLDKSYNRSVDLFYKLSGAYYIPLFAYILTLILILYSSCLTRGQSVVVLQLSAE